MISQTFHAFRHVVCASAAVCLVGYTASAAGAARLHAQPPSPHAVGTTSVSVNAGGGQANADSFGPSLSSDGQYVVFYSYASDLVGGDTNGVGDVFIRNLATGTTSLVSVAVNGAEGNNSSYGGRVSADGRLVTFTSFASNLVSDDTNNSADVFVRDLQTGVTSLVSLTSTGVQANGFSDSASLSGDGRFVAFTSAATNLGADDRNRAADVFVRDLVARKTWRLSVSTAGAGGNAGSFALGVSADGRYVVFKSVATNLVSGDTNAVQDIFVRDRVARMTSRVTAGFDGSQADGVSYSAAISAHGRYITFDSDATNLVFHDTNHRSDIFVADSQTGTTRRVSLGPAGLQGTADSSAPVISGAGRYVLFTSDATNLVAGDSGAHADVFLRDRLDKTTSRVSTSSAGGQPDNSSYGAAISSDGLSLAFYSFASNVVAGDTNGSADVFLSGTPTS